MKASSKISSWGIFVGFFIGAVLGLVFHYFKGSAVYLPFAGEVDLIEIISDNFLWPAGKVFLYALFMIIVPLVFSSLIVGVSEMSGPSSIGRLSKRLFAFYVLSTFVAILIGQTLMGVFKPGEGIPPEEVDKAVVTMQEKMADIKEKSSMVGESLWPGILTKIVPKNIISAFGQQNMLAVIFVSLLFGLSLLYLPKGPPRETFINGMVALSGICVVIIRWVMKTAPYAVAALIAVAVYQLGPEVLHKLGKYVAVITCGLLLHLFGTYSLFLKFLVKIPVLRFFFKMRTVLSTAFGTSSSSATMPVTMNTLERKFGAPRKIVSFSVPIGTVVNMDGTALFEVAATLFIAQIFGIDLSIGSALLLALVVFITSVGIAGVPGGSIPVLMSSIVIFGIPAEGIALILGVDRLMDMGRTVVNVTGDSIATLYLAKKEGVDIKGFMKNRPD